MRRKKSDEAEEILNQVQDEEEELSEKEIKKKKQKEAIEKRKNAKRKDKVARWGGLILLGLIMFFGFLLWVFGEMKQDPTPTTPVGASQKNTTPFATQRGSVIVK